MRQRSQRTANLRGRQSAGGERMLIFVQCQLLAERRCLHTLYGLRARHVPADGVYLDSRYGLCQLSTGKLLIVDRCDRLCIVQYLPSESVRESVMRSDVRHAVRAL